MEASLESNEALRSNFDAVAVSVVGVVVVDTYVWEKMEGTL